MKTQGFLIQALSPLHVGTGQAADIIELPIARMKSTGIPYVPGSSIKGVLRDQCTCESKHKNSIFGPSRDPKKEGVEGDNATDLDRAGALVVSDARLLALPVRSFKGTFCFVTSPLLLHLWKRDMEVLGLSFPEVPKDKGDKGKAWVLAGPENINTMDKKIYLEDLDLPVSKDSALETWSDAIKTFLPDDERNIFEKRFVIADDDTMSFLWETATQLDTRIRIDSRTGVVDGGALWTEESLPSETLLSGMLCAYDERGKTKEERMSAEQVLKGAVDGRKYLQFGGKATIGRGRCRFLPMEGK